MERPTSDYLSLWQPEVAKMSVDAIGGHRSGALAGVGGRLVEFDALNNRPPAPVGRVVNARVEAEPGGERQQAGQDYLERLKKAVETLNGATEIVNKQLEFVLHEGSGRMMVRVIDSASQEVIKEVPPEAVLEAVARVREIIGLLLDERA